MHKKIIQLIFKQFWNRERLTNFEVSALDYYMKNCSEQERAYFTKLATAYF